MHDSDLSLQVQELCITTSRLVKLLEGNGQKGFVRQTQDDIFELRQQQAVQAATAATKDGLSQTAKVVWGLALTAALVLSNIAAVAATIHYLKP